MDRLTYEHLTNEEHIAFHKTAIGIFASRDLDALGVGKQYADYTTSYDEEASTFDLVRADARILEMENRDYLVNSLYRGMFDTVKSMLEHYHEDKRIASFHITLLVSYYDNVFLDPDNDEVLTMDDLLRDLNDNLISQIMALRITDWMALLEAANAKLNQLASALQSELQSETLPEVRMRPARNKTDKAFCTMFDRIEALAIINGAEPYEALAKEMNRATERCAKVLREHKTPTIN